MHIGNNLTSQLSLIDRPIKKLMLTGVADESLAVQGFNEGIIDHFVGLNRIGILYTLGKCYPALKILITKMNYRPTPTPQMHTFLKSNIKRSNHTIFYKITVKIERPDSPDGGENLKNG